MRKRFFLSLCGFITLLFGLFIVLGLLATHPLAELRLAFYGFVSGFMITTSIYIVIFDRATKKAEQRNHFWSDYSKRKR